MADDKEANVASETATNEAEETKETKKTVESQETEETASEETQETKVDFEAELQKDRSKRGREMKELKDELASMKDLIAANTQQTTVKPDEQYVTTVADLDRWDEAKKQKESQIIRDYDTKYIKSLDGLGEQEDLSDEEIKEMGILLNSKFKNFYSGYADPISDADRNFYRALSEMRKGTKKTPNLKGDTPKGTSVNVTTKITDKETEVPKLDKAAQEFVDYHKMDDKTVTKSLSGEISGGLKNKMK